MVVHIANGLGWLLARGPEIISRLLAAVLGELVWWVVPRRRRQMLYALSRAFPQRSDADLRRMARQSARWTMETALLAAAMPHLTVQQLRRIGHLSESSVAAIDAAARKAKPYLLCSPHMGAWELLTSLPVFYDGTLPPIGVIFRPLNHPGINEMVVRTRERFGMRLLSRKEGFSDAMRILRDGGVVGILFDQNAGPQGSLIPFLGRPASATDLPGLLAERFEADCAALYSHRTGFWRYEIRFKTLELPYDRDAVTLSLNRWLEELLSSDDALCASWLWMHNRWKQGEKPEARLGLQAKRSLLSHANPLPKRFRLWLRLPESDGAVEAIAALLPRLMAARPDAEITVLAPNKLASRLQQVLGAAPDRLVFLSPNAPERRAQLARLQVPDTVVLFDPDPAAAREAAATGARQRFGFAGPSSRWLTHSHQPADTTDLAARWDLLLQQFGLPPA
jgi:heptosyltransferase II